MGSIAIRDMIEADYAAVVELNAGEVRNTSPMDEARLRELVGYSAFAKVAAIGGEVAGFMLAMRDGAAYVNDNFAWFSARYPSFLYVDRVVVDAKRRGQGVGARIYEAIFDFARDAGIPLVTCEINSVPPNEPSRRFHEKLGFAEVGTQWLAGGSKQVSMRAKPLVFKK